MKDSRMFLQDGNPRHNSASALIERRGYEIFSNPARSPDLNPIENMFNLVRKQLNEDAMAMNITKDNYEEFGRRLKETIERFSADIINKIIKSLLKRMELVIKGKGSGIKY